MGPHPPERMGGCTRGQGLGLGFGFGFGFGFGVRVRVRLRVSHLAVEVADDDVRAVLLDARLG